MAAYTGQENTLKFGASKVFMLVGVPGSGKSTFAASLGSAGYKVISSDNLRSKKGAFDEEVGIYSKPSQLSKQSIVIDRCCVTVEERLRLMALMHNPLPTDVTVVYFNKDIEDCKMQVTTRKGHPTISEGKNGRSIVDGFVKKLVPPALKEGYGRIEIVESYQQSESFLKSIGINPVETVNTSFVKKFPRTSHLLDAGGEGVTRDDLVMSARDATAWIQNAEINVEEKIDGANLGISLSEQYLPLYQNRSHFINSTSASQWKGLDRWWKEHSTMLLSLLEPGRHVLFGEWCALQHSIHYDSLPAYFIAFDVYDAVEDRFYSRQRLYEFLEPTGIPVIKTIVNKQFETPQQLLPLLETVSAYGARKSETDSINRPVEGIYLRIDKGDWLDRRCKIVRPDFVQAIEEHWCKRTPVKNCMRY